ncbi:P-type conjugative transfer protein TrbG, partial [Rhizobium sp. BR 317]
MHITKIFAAAGCLAGLVFVSGAQAQSMSNNEVKGTN